MGKIIYVVPNLEDHLYRVEDEEIDDFCYIPGDGNGYSGDLTFNRNGEGPMGSGNGGGWGDGEESNGSGYESGDGGKDFEI